MPLKITLLPSVRAQVGVALRDHGRAGMETGVERSPTGALGDVTRTAAFQSPVMWTCG